MPQAGSALRVQLYTGWLEPVNLSWEFPDIGGLELLFGNQKEYDVDVPCNGQGLTVGQLIPWTRDQLLKDRPELFMKGNTVPAAMHREGVLKGPGLLLSAMLCAPRRPGILVLINDCDWELSGTLDATLEEGDTVLFISTLHGG